MTYFTGHARLSASSATRWVACPGSVEAGMGRESTSALAAEGTLAHFIASECLERQVQPEKWLGDNHMTDGYNVLCGTDMVDAVRVYLDFVTEESPVGSISWYEMKLDTLRKIDSDMGGTADFVNYRPLDRHLLVADYKHGAGVYVDPEENLQAIIYAMGAMLKVNEPIDTVEIAIVQPRFSGAAPIRRWSFTAFEVMERAAQLQEAAIATRKKNAPLVAGSHCQFCPAIRDCPEVEKKHHAVVAMDFHAVTGEPSLTSVAEALAAIPLVKARIKAIEEYAYTEACKGVEIPGFKLVDKKAVRKYKSEGEVILWAEQMALDPYAPREVLSPAQLEKRLKESLPKGKKKDAAALIEPLVDKVSSGLALVSVDDSRQPAKQLQIEDFAIIEGNADKTTETTPLSLLP